MAITDYSGLSTAAYRRLNRTAETAVFNDCVALTEAEINRRLALAPVRPQHVRATATIDAEYFAAPTGIMDVDSFKLAMTHTTDQIHSTTDQNMAAMFEADDTTGQPRFYAQVGDTFRFYPAPDATYAATLTYWAKVPALTSVATTNWVSLAHPDVYLTGILAHAMRDYLYETKDINAEFELFNIALDRMLSAYPKRVDRAPLRSDPILRRYDFFNITNG